MGMTYENLVRMIAGAGKEPVERDSLYQPVRREPGAVPSVRSEGTAPGSRLQDVVASAE